MTAKRKYNSNSDFYCDHYGQNDSHDTVDCILLKADLNGTSWKNPKHKEHSNYNKVYWHNKQHEVNLLQKENFEERKKYKNKIFYLKNKSKNFETESSHSSKD